MLVLCNEKKERTYQCSARSEQPGEEESSFERNGEEETSRKRRQRRGERMSETTELNTAEKDNFVTYRRAVFNPT